MIPSNLFKKGVKVLIDNEPYVIVEAQFVKPGKGSAFTRTKFKGLVSGRQFERNVRSGESYPKADVEEVDMDYLYNDGTGYVFMNTNTYEQVTVTEDGMGDASKFIIENTRVKVQLFNGQAISVELPNFIELQITMCEPGVKGNTATGAVKPATLSTGATVNVPLFIEQGETIRVDTRTGSYADRVKK